MYFQAYFPSQKFSYIQIRPKNYSIIIFNSGINLKIQSVCVYMRARTILLYMCPHTPIYVSSYFYICVLILLYMCPHTTICVLILLCMCPHTTMCVLILIYVCPHTAIYVSAYQYMCPHTTSICILILLCVLIMRARAHTITITRTHYQRSRHLYDACMYN